MAPKNRPTKRMTGSGAAKASATAPEEAQEVAVAAVMTAMAGECVLPPDPEDPRLTLKGVVLAGDGKIDVAAYEDLVPAFAKEPTPDQHPDPEKPGTRRGEQIPKGLRVWDDIRAGNADKDGAGWIAVRSASQHEKKKEKWFNIRTCGSWRMAFLLAKLQRLHWDEHAEWLKRIAAPVGPGAGASTREAQPPATPPPKAKRPRAAGAGEGEAAKKVAKQTTKAEAEEKAKSLPAAAPGALIGAGMLAGSVRLQQILAARQLQQQQQQQQ